MCFHSCTSRRSVRSGCLEKHGVLTFHQNARCSAGERHPCAFRENAPPRRWNRPTRPAPTNNSPGVAIWTTLQAAQRLAAAYPVSAKGRLLERSRSFQCQGHHGMRQLTPKRLRLRPPELRKPRFAIGQVTSAILLPRLWWLSVKGVRYEQLCRKFPTNDTEILTQVVFCGFRLGGVQQQSINELLS